MKSQMNVMLTLPPQHGPIHGKRKGWQQFTVGKKILGGLQTGLQQQQPGGQIFA